MKRQDLVEKMVEVGKCFNERHPRAEAMLDVVLSAIEDGYVIGKRCSECGKDYRLLPDFQRSENEI